MIIDCHGHYTTAPEPHQKYRQLQQAQLEDATLPDPEYGVISCLLYTSPSPRDRG